MAMYRQRPAFGFVVALESAGKFVYSGTDVIDIVGSGAVLDMIVAIEIAVLQNSERWIERTRKLLRNSAMNQT
jgi:hypothetical protein